MMVFLLLLLPVQLCYQLSPYVFEACAKYEKRQRLKRLMYPRWVIGTCRASLITGPGPLVSHHPVRWAGSSPPYNSIVSAWGSGLRRSLLAAHRTLQVPACPTLPTLMKVI